MLFSYYFDIEKTHLLNCNFLTQNLTQKTNGIMELTFTAYIEEIKEGTSFKKAATVGTFHFDLNKMASNGHNIDFIRTRYAPDNKWIFQIINNQNPSEQVTLGLIASIDKNPLGLEISYDNDQLDVQLKANNLAQLEKTYVPPIINQIIIDEHFDTLKYPEGFTSSTSRYNETLKLIELSDFVIAYSDPILPGTAFNISMNLAPASVLPSYGNEILRFQLDKIGTISMLTNGIQYLKYNASPDQAVFDTFKTPISPQTFYNNGFTNSGLLKINGDGKGQITIQYGDATIKGPYDPTVTSQSLTYETSNDLNGKIQSKLDNLIISYQK